MGGAWRRRVFGVGGMPGNVFHFILRMRRTPDLKMEIWALGVVGTSASASRHNSRTEQKIFSFVFEAEGESCNGRRYGLLNMWC